MLVFLRDKRDVMAQSLVTLRHVDVDRRRIYFLYANDKVPTIVSLRDSLINDDIEYSKSTLWSLLKANGFKYKTNDRRQRLIKNSKICTYVANNELLAINISIAGKNYLLPRATVVWYPWNAQKRLEW